MFSIPSHACQPIIPSEANIIARRAPIPLFGAGLVEAIPDETLMAMQDPNDDNRDGVSGRAAIITDIETGDRRVGRFGWKAQHATLMAFGADAYRNEMGITNDLFPSELAFGVSAERMRQCDRIPDPEDIIEPATKRRGIDNFESFMKFLGPPPRGAVDDQARAGERVFSDIGCAACHVPALMTGRSENPLFDRKVVAALLRSAAARHRHRRRHRSGGRDRRGDPHAGAVGTARAPAAAARRQRSDDRGRDRASCRRSRSCARRLPGASARSPRRAARIPAYVVVFCSPA